MVGCIGNEPCLQVNFTYNIKVWILKPSLLGHNFIYKIYRQRQKIIVWKLLKKIKNKSLYEYYKKKKIILYDVCVKTRTQSSNLLSMEDM